MSGMCTSKIPLPKSATKKTNRLSRTRVLFVRLRVRKEVTGVGAFNLANGDPRIYLSMQLYWHFDSRSDSRSDIYAYPISPDLEF